jgi:oligopeptide/dipeptide ABC transporter ATP-binding protein
MESNSSVINKPTTEGQRHEKIVEVKNIKKYYPIHGGLFNRTVSVVKALDNVTFDIFKGETLGIVGESGSGKSTLGRVILRLLKPTEGSITFKGRDITNISEKEMSSYRRDMQMIFQDPYGSLNNKATIGDMLIEPMNVHGIFSKNKRKLHAIELLDTVGLAKESMKKYPYEFSGGQRQRIAIARALVIKPELIIADEPVSALDVSLQSQVLNLMKDLQEKFELTYLFISHDLSVVKHMSDRIGVMYLGKIMELAPKRQLYKTPLHPYTQALLSAIPSPSPFIKKEKIILQGDLPSPSNPPSGCVFRTRCSKVHDECERREPELKSIGKSHFVACH